VYFVTYNTALCVLARTGPPYMTIQEHMHNEMLRKGLSFMPRYNFSDLEDHDVTFISANGVRLIYHEQNWYLNTFGTVLLAISMAFNLHITLMEFLQFLMEGSAYFTDLNNLNLFDVSQLTLQYLVSALYFVRAYFCAIGDMDGFWALKAPTLTMDVPHQREGVLEVLGAVASVLSFFRFMSVMRGSTNLSYLLLMLRVILADMIPFLVVLTVFMIVSTNALVILTSDAHPDYNDIRTILFSAYVLPLLAEFDRTNYNRRFSFSLMLVVFTLIATIVMLNMLIAIMSESYARVRENINDRRLLERAMLILEEQDLKVYGDKITEWLEDFVLKMFPCFRRCIERRRRLRDESSWFPAWLHCLVKRKYVAETARSETEDVRELLHKMRVQAERDRAALLGQITQLVKVQQHTMQATQASHRRQGDDARS